MSTRNVVPRDNGEGQLGTSVKQWQQVHAQQIFKAGQAVAELASPSFTGTPTAPTPAGSENSTRIATTEFVQALLSDLLSSEDIFIRKISTTETEWLSNAEFSGGGYLSLAAGYCWRLLFSSGNVKFQFYNASGASEGITWSNASFQTQALTLLGTSVLTISENAGKTQARTELGLGTSAVLNVPSTGNAATGEVVKGDDTRLTNSRTCNNTFDNAATARTNLGLAIGTNVQAYNVILAYLSALTAASGKMIYFDSASSMALADITTYGRSVVAAADAAANLTILGIATGISNGNYLLARNTPASGEFARFTADGIEGLTASEARTALGLVIGTNVQAYSAILGYLAGVTPAANKLPYFNSSTSMTVADLTATGISIIGAASAGDVLTLLGLVIGTNVQAYSARLAEIAALAVTDGNIIVGNGTAWVAESGATARTSLDVSRAAFSKGYRAVTSDTDIVLADETVAFNVTGGSRNAVLKSEICAAGRRVTVKKTDSSANTVTISSDVGNVEGAATLVLSTQDASVTLEFSGANWIAVSEIAANKYLKVANNLSEISTAGTQLDAIENIGLQGFRKISDDEFELVVGAYWNGTNYTAYTIGASRYLFKSPDFFMQYAASVNGNFDVSEFDTVFEINQSDNQIEFGSLNLIIPSQGISFTGTGAADTLENLGVPLNNYAATAAPTTGDDTADGYSVGSNWYDTTNDDAYVCLDASAGAAVWKKTTP